MFQVNIHATTPFKMYAYWKNKGADKRLERLLQRLRLEAQYQVRMVALKNIVKKVQRTAVNDYMHKGGGKPKADKVTIRSGELATAVLNKEHPSHVEIIKTSAAGHNFSAIFGAKGSDELPYPGVQEHGRQISAKPTNKSGFMSFTLWNGEHRQAASVYVPPRPFMQPALKKVVKNDAAAVVNDEIEKVIARLGFVRW